MKKIKAVLTTGIISSTVNAQTGDYDRNFNLSPEAFRIIATLFFVCLLIFFIINILKHFYEYRLKNKIVDKGISENIASSILKTKAGEDKNINIKWFAILAGLGIGLTGVNYTQPIGIHSLAIMAFSISLSFLGYYLFIRNTGK